VRTLLSAALCAVLSAAPTLAAPQLRLPNPYIHKGACPFECCTYRDWTTIRPVTLLDRPGGKVTIAHIGIHQHVLGLTGEVHVKPVRLVAARDYGPVHKGAIFYALHPLGEGYWVAWYQGKLVEVEFDNNEVPYEHQHWLWWVKIRTRGGQVGWVLDNLRFDNQDACG
jgi:hypothetical protein